MYDYLIVGSGLFGATFAYEAGKRGKSCLVVEKRPHIGGNIYTEEVEGIQVHRYGAHIFHTSNRKVWDYVQQFAEFNRYTNCPVAYYKGEIYNMPFNMNTFHKMWGVVTPKEAQEKIASQIRECGVEKPGNLEEQALSLVGRDIYERLVKGYTEKQWGRRATELPPEIIRRLPVRFTYDNNYFNDLYQGIPVGGYTQIIRKMLEKAEVRLNLDMENYQGNAVVNYTEYEVPYTRIIEHKHFEFGTQEKTVISREYPAEWKPGDEPYYPINNEKNNRLYERYRELADREEKVVFGGRLGVYRYMDMHHVVGAALELAEKELH